MWHVLPHALLLPLLALLTVLGPPAPTLALAPPARPETALLLGDWLWAAPAGGPGAVFRYSAAEGRWAAVPDPSDRVAEGAFVVAGSRLVWASAVGWEELLEVPDGAFAWRET
eukprot:EG_transcript_45758